jgi:predicted Zn-dependent protease
MAEVLMSAGEHHLARKELEQLLREQEENGAAYRLLAKLEAESGNHPASYLARAEYLYLSGEPYSAIEQLTQAKKLSPLPHYYATRIDARLDQIKSEVSLLRSQ